MLNLTIPPFRPGIDDQWVLTDDDCAQYRRRLPDQNGGPVFELVQVNQYGASLFKVALGFVLWNDIKDDVDDLMAYYSYDAASLEALGSEAYGIIAEAVFETAATEYDGEEEYATFEEAAAVVDDYVRMRSMQKQDPYVQALDDALRDIDKIFDTAFALNMVGAGSALSRLCTDRLVGVKQNVQAVRDMLNEKN